MTFLSTNSHSPNSVSLMLNARGVIVLNPFHIGKCAV